MTPETNEILFDPNYRWECPTCGIKLPGGIIGISSHWAECGGKGTMAFINKLAENKSLKIEDKMDLIKKQFNIEQ